MLATLLGMPTSTTHALTGALVGAAMVSDGGSVQWAAIGIKFAQPLLLSPVIAIVGTVALYLPLRWLRRFGGVQRETCICVGQEQTATVTVPLLVGGQLSRNGDGMRRIVVDIDHGSQAVPEA